MRVEAKIALGIGAVIGLYELSHYAFTPGIAQEILQRDHFVCQGIDKQNPCIVTALYGRPASANDGFFVTASHWDHSRRTVNYNKPETGRCQCVCCHMLYEKKLGHDWAFDKMGESNVFKRHCGEEPEKFPLYNPRLDTGRSMLNYIQKTMLERKRYDSGTIYQAEAAK